MKWSGWNSMWLSLGVGGGRWMVLALWRKGQEELPVSGGSWNLTDGERTEVG
jgi:hypothetical protein